MILKKLTLKGFSPYRTEQSVDLTRYLGRTFLITGDTGAGKTSIFDGIIYALYGKASGALRSESTLRNQELSKKEESFAELSFSVNGTDYLVHRAVRADGKAAKKDDCRLTWEDKYVEGKTAVTDEITRLLGFDADAFCRISMLAQGEFSEFLNMKSGDREKVLRRVFGTYLYEQFENKLKERADAGRTARTEAEAKYRAVSAGMRRYLPDGDDGLFEDLSRCGELCSAVSKLGESTSEELAQAEKREQELRVSSAEASSAEAAGRALNGRFDALDKARAELDALRSLGTGNEAKKLRLAMREKAERVKPYSDRANDRAKMLAEKRGELSTAEKAAQSAAVSLEKARAEAAKISEMQSERDQLISQKPALDMLAGAFSRREELSAQLKLHEKSAAKAEKTLKQTEEQLKAAAEEETSLSERRKTAEETAAKSPLYKKELDEYKRADGDCAALIKSLKALAGANSELTERGREYESAAALSDEKELAFNTAQGRFYANAAWRLAQRLGKGEACPVCGSTEHPAPAHSIENAPTEDEINALKDESDRLRELRGEADKHLAKAQERLNAAENSAAEMYKRVFGVEPETEALYSAESAAAEKRAEIKAGIKLAEKALSEAEAAAELSEKTARELADISEKTKEYAERRAAAEAEISRARENIAAVSAQLEDCAGRISENTSALKMPDGEGVPEDKSAAEKLSEKWSCRVAGIEAAVPALEQGLKQAESASAEASGALGKSRENAESAAEASAAAEREFIRAAEENGFSDTAAAERALMTEEEYARLTDEVNGYAERLAAAEKLLSTITEELSGKQRADIAALSERSGELSRRLSEVTRSAGSLTELGAALAAGGKQLAAARTEYDNVCGKYAGLGELAALVSGKGTGAAAKLSLERYVQGQFFDEVLKRANVRLNGLSGGRYSFVRRISNAKASQTSGLDIDVADLNAGPDTVRSVSTLSGGESFLASFALAIGLSDYTMEVNGGRATDVLFVDEGFSALDENTFEQAMDVINGISSENRLVGIVSHVREIREHFTEEIYIRKGNDGSRIEQKL